MTSFHVTQAVLDTIRAAGFHIGETGVLSLLDGEPREVVNAVDAKTGESFTVAAPDQYTAAVWPQERRRPTEATEPTEPDS